jgi:DNA-binding winged helix-turn-helix (wHTH) protein/Tol biopolymer transport system component
LEEQFLVRYFIERLLSRVLSFESTAGSMRTDFRLGEWLVQPELNRVRGSEGDVHLEPRVMDVLVYLARHAREVLPKERIIQAVWSDAFVSDEVLSRAVKELRKAFGDDAKDAKVVATIPRRGYRLLLPVAGIPEGASANDPTRPHPGAHELPTNPGPPRKDSGRPGTAAARRTAAIPVWAWIAVTAVAGIVVGALLYGLYFGEPAADSPRRESGAAQVFRSRIDLPPGTRLSGVDSLSGAPIPIRREIALSPGGDLLVFSATTTAEPIETRLYRRPLDGDRAEPMAGTEGAGQPFFSPDGRWIGFFSGGRLRKIPAGGGIPHDLGAVHFFPAGASWTEDGRILLGHWRGALHWIPEEGGTPEALTELDRTRETRQMLPRALPGGRGVLFTATPHGWGPEARIEVLTPSDGRRRTLLEDAADGHYVPGGHLVFLRRGRLMAVPFHLGKLEATDPAAPIRDHVRQALNIGFDVDHSAAGQFSASATGVLAYASGGIGTGYPVELIWVDRRGRVEVVEGFDEPFFTHPRLSPCGGYIAYCEQAEAPADTRGGLWVFDRERLTRSRLLSRGISGAPAWSPDGKRLAVAWSEAGPQNVWVVPVEARGEARRLTESDRRQFPASWAPDGRHLAIVEEGDILVYRFEDDSLAPFVATEAGEWQPVFSPDGRWLAYVSNETGRSEVYVTSFPARDQRIVVSSGGGGGAIWSRSGSELFYRGPRHFMRVNLRYGDRISADAPTALFDRSGMDLAFWGRADAAFHPGGERFLLARRKSPDPEAERAWTEPVTHLNLVTNWFEELKRLHPPE